MGYPVTFEADYAERRSRLTTFFRLVLMIPLFVWYWLWGIGATIAVMLAWFAIVITGSYPPGLYDFVARFTRFTGLVTGYGVLLCDRYPPFGGDDDSGYPVRVRFAGPLSQYSRLKALLRFILAIPLFVLRYAIGLVLELIAFLAWVVIVVTGELPRGLFDVLAICTSYTIRSDAYLYLLTESYPPFQDTTTGAEFQPPRAQ